MKYYMGPGLWEPTIEDLSAAGHERVEALEDAEAYIFTSGNPRDFPSELPESITFVQYGFTGVNHLIKAGLIEEGGVRWANTAGAFAVPVAESALGLLLGQAHQHKAAATHATWSAGAKLDEDQAWLYSPKGQDPKEVAIFGAGGIGKALISMLKPFGCRITAVNRTGNEVEGADRTVAIDDAEDVWGSADFIVLIMPLTDLTRGMVDKEKFKAMKDSAILVNVGRGPLVVTDDLVWALENGEIAGAGLEVVDPEPLPDGHPLWSLPNCTMTPHIAASELVAQWHIGDIFLDNVAALEAGERMPTEVDPAAGY